MVTRARIVERSPVEGVEIEYALATTSKRSTKPRFKRGRLLAITNETIDLGSREAFHAGDTLAITFHTQRVKDLFHVNAGIDNCTRITVLKQPAFCVTLTFTDPDDSQKRKIAWAVDQYTVKGAPRRLQRTPPLPAPAAAGEAPKDTGAADPGQATAVRPDLAAADQSDSNVRRPVALLELIRTLDDFDVSDDLVLAVIEAAETGTDVEALFPVSQAVQTETQEEEEGEEEAEEAAPLPSQARPLNLYRLAPNTTLHFSAAGLPAGPAAGMFYYSGIESPHNCFAIELGLDIMTQDGRPSFPEGTVLVFSVNKPVETRDFAYMKVRGNDLFAQVFFGEKDNVRIRFLNSKYPEVTVKRREMRVMCKLVGSYHPNT